MAVLETFNTKNVSLECSSSCIRAILFLKANTPITLMRHPKRQKNSKNFKMFISVFSMFYDYQNLAINGTVANCVKIKGQEF